ncbi:hypothetical protein [Candidatus Villigracilis proximus]|uniref:hypothetical protein n=1 Tax=Candidatus Villigracilis proximus TaxID=3140683 RepID=UPI0031EDF264
MQEAIEKILSDNPKEVEQFLAGKETIVQWLMGQVARATKGKATRMWRRSCWSRRREKRNRKINNAKNP